MILLEGLGRLAPGIVYNRYYGGRWQGYRTMRSGTGTTTRLGDFGGAAPDPDGVSTWLFHQYATGPSYGTYVAEAR